MVSLFRSEEMCYLQAIVPEEAAHTFAHELAQFGCSQITDMNGDVSAFQRRYMKDILRIIEIERKLGQIETHLQNYEVPYAKPADKFNPNPEEPPIDIVERIEGQVMKYYQELQDVNRVMTELDNSLEQAKEFVFVLTHVGQLLQQKGLARNMLEEKKRDEEGPHDDLNIPMLDMDHEARRNPDQLGFAYVAGTVSQTMQPVLERQAFLVTRGNVYCLFSEPDEHTKKCAFALFFLGGNIRRKLTRLCESLSIHLYLFPENSGDLQQQIGQSQSNIRELEDVATRTRQQLTMSLRMVAQRFASWRLTLLQEKTLLAMMNRMKPSGRTLVTQLWAPLIDKPKVQIALDRALEGRGLGRFTVSEVPTNQLPPTYFRTNEFTGVFQTIVNTYGVPRYREVNPGLFTIVTFPFLFGMMFGDIGHGFALMLFGLFLCFKAARSGGKPSGEMESMLFGGRYLLTMMGFFAAYTGFIYNDCLSLSLDLFGSQYQFPTNGTNVAAIKTSDTVYPFGLDPIWHASSQDLSVYNSLKMKMSVIVGITQMTFGLFLSVFNHVHYGNYLNIVCEFIPQFIFMMSLFGYLIFMIITKWSTNWAVPIATGTLNGKPCYAEAPNLITTLINMVLSIGTVECKMQLYEGQAGVQAALVYLAGIAVPWMLIPKPLILYLMHRKKEEVPHHELDEESKEEVKEEPKSAGHGDHGHGHGEFEIGEVVIHQMIHTIEYVLGTISNTASYLRLWALSLAHAELARVFFEKVLVMTWKMGNPVAILIGAAVWLAATVVVLMAMDVLECFLHALRLHWVEFQNKFYYADGVAFAPFTYNSLLEDTA